MNRAIAIFLIVLINTSFIEERKKYFEGVTSYDNPVGEYKYGYNIGIYTKIIQAKNEREAKGKFNEFMKAIRPPGKMTSYSINEILTEDILK